MQIELPPTAHAARLAREFVSEHCTALPPAVLHDAVLLTSEIVSNAVLHGQSAITLDIRTDPPSIGIAVHDDNDTVPRAPEHAPDPTQPSGRGLLIVAAIASAWGVIPSDDKPGKTVWFELHPS